MFDSTNLMMNRLRVIGFVIFFTVFQAKAQSPSSMNDPSSEDSNINFQPSLAVVIGILSLMFTLTFILLIYAKFCHRAATSSVHGDNNPAALHRSRSRFSGIDKTVIESLPFFRFSSLKGSKRGLECAVCLSKFEDIEILRLLPQCKHAFHIGCIDQWLEKHSSCPLCRHKVSAEDPAIFAYSNSMRFLWNQSELREDSNVELYVQREEDRQGSSRFSIGSSFRKAEKGNKEKDVLIQEEASEMDDDQKMLHKFKHKIVVSDIVFKNRWSSVSSSDLMMLNSEILNEMSSNRFSRLEESDGKVSIRPIENEQIMKIKEEMERKRSFENKLSSINKESPASGPNLPPISISTASSSQTQTSRIVDQTEKRSMSEITALSRFRYFGMNNRTGESSLSGRNVKEDRIRQRWLPIARRTIQWFAHREGRSQCQQSQNRTELLDV